MADPASFAFQVLAAQPEGEPLGKRARSKLERRDRILRSAREIFAEKGFAAATTQEISDRAQVAAGTLFLYARTKEELLVAAFIGDMGEVAAQAEATLPVGAPVLDQLTHLFGALVDYHQTLGAALSAELLKELMYRPGYDSPRGDRGSMRIGQMAQEIIERGRSSRELRATIDPDQTVDMLFSMFHWQLSHWAIGRLSLETLKEQIRYRFDLCIRGLRR